MPVHEIKICYLPGRESSYARTRTLIKGMREAGCQFYDCSSPDKKSFRYISSFLKFLKTQRKSDIIFVGFLGQPFVPFVKLFSRKKILFDAFISVYQTLAFDRKSIHPKSLLSHLARFLDRFSCKLSDGIILDTQEHINYFVKEYGLDKNKFSRIFVGADDSVVYPRKKTKNPQFLVHFHGEFQELHGAPTIVEAARLLPQIKFQMIGKGKMLKCCVERSQECGLTNIDFIPPVSFEQLAERMARAHICLGIFGKTQKAKMVIPCKAYESLAMGKPLITSDTPAAREILTHQENAILCQPADPKKLAESIMLLYENEQLRKKIAQNGFMTFKEKCAPVVLGKEIQKITNSMFSPGKKSLSP